MLFIIFTTFFVSLLFGSFFNVVIDRVYRGEQILKGRSYCEKCKRLLGALDLIPIVSFVLLLGKCRYCKHKIPPILAVVELTTGILFALVMYWYLNYLNPWSLPLGINELSSLFLLYISGALLILIFFTDLKYMVIPDIYLYALFFLYLLFFVLNYFNVLDLGIISNYLFSDFKDHLYAAATLGIFFGVLHFAFKGKAMGEGDIYLATILGLYLGISLSIVMWFTAFLTGSIIGLILIIANVKKLKSTIAFGPFLVLGFLIAITYGYAILNWYFELFLI